MNVREEVMDLVGQIKRQLRNSQEIGLDAPFLSTTGPPVSYTHLTLPTSDLV